MSGADETEAKCGWCGNRWAVKHECRALSTFTLPCYRCGGDVASKPSGYGLAVDFLGPSVRVRHRGYSLYELCCSEKCAAAVRDAEVARETEEQ